MAGSMFKHRRLVKACTVTLAASLLVAGIGSAADAYSYVHCGNKDNPLKVEGRQIRYGAASAGFPAGHPAQDALVRATQRWNKGPGDFEFLEPSFGDDYHRKNNGDDEIWFTNKQSLLDGSPARAFTRRTCLGGIKESDIVFDAGVAWSFTDTRSSKEKYGGSLSDWNTTALHEMGHSLGLKHVNGEYNIMGSDQTHTHANSNEVRANVGEDAGHGEAFMYGKGPGNVTDVGVSHWKYSGVNGEYSHHERTKMYNVSNGKYPPNIDFDGMRQYRVNRGSAYNVEFTYENNGFSTQNNVKLGFYVSTDNRITTMDRLVTTRTLDSLAVGNVLTDPTTITIPNDLVKGMNYWLGVIIDSDGAIAENDELNATFMPILIN